VVVVVELTAVVPAVLVEVAQAVTLVMAAALMVLLILGAVVVETGQAPLEALSVDPGLLY
jgi:hypothetical protein